MNLRKRVQNLEIKIGRTKSSLDPDLIGLSKEELMALLEEEVKKVPPPPPGMDLERVLEEAIESRKKGPMSIPWKGQGLKYALAKTSR